MYESIFAKRPWTGKPKTGHNNGLPSPDSDSGSWAKWFPFCYSQAIYRALYGERAPSIWLIVQFVLRVRQQIGRSTRFPRQAQSRLPFRFHSARSGHLLVERRSAPACRVHNNLNARHTKWHGKDKQRSSSVSGAACPAPTPAPAAALANCKWLRDRMHCSGLHLNPKAAATKLARQRVAVGVSQQPEGIRLFWRGKG